MYEKEIKILNINKLKLIKKLEELGASKTFEGYIHDVYYDYPKWDIDNEGRSFRVRTKWADHLYTIKQKKKEKDSGEMRIVIEQEHKITNVESFKKVLQKYGLEKAREKKKMRISYTLGEITFDIDKYYGIPWLLEIEWAGYLTVKYWLEKLDIHKHERKKFGSRGLYKHYDKDLEKPQKILKEKAAAKKIAQAKRTQAKKTVKKKKS